MHLNRSKISHCPLIATASGQLKVLLVLLSTGLTVKDCPFTVFGSKLEALLWIGKVFTWTAQRLSTDYNGLWAAQGSARSFVPLSPGTPERSPFHRLLGTFVVDSNTLLDVMYYQHSYLFLSLPTAFHRPVVLCECWLCMYPRFTDSHCPTSWSTWVWMCVVFRIASNIA